MKLRIFDDEAGVMNRSVVDAGGDVLVVSQFTLYASTCKGNRPSYVRAAGPEAAVPLYERFVAVTGKLLGRPVQTGGHVRQFVVTDRMLVRSRYAGRTGERRAGNDLDRFETERILTTYKGGRI